MLCVMLGDFLPGRMIVSFARALVPMRPSFSLSAPVKPWVEGFPRTGILVRSISEP